MKEPEVFVLKGGMMHHYLVEQDDDFVYLLSDQIVIVDVKVVERKTFNRDFRPFKPSTPLIKRLSGITRSTKQNGITAYAAKQLIPLMKSVGEKFTPEEFQKARALGDATVARWKASAKHEEAKMAEAAPRKLAGAALQAKLRKEERERQAQVDEGKKALENPAAATALKDVAQEVTEDLKDDEAKGKPDVRVSNSRKEKKNPDAPTKARAAAAKETVKRVDATARRERADKESRKELKSADGEYKSASAMFRGLLLENATRKIPKSDEVIFKEVQAKFGLSDDKISYVGWNRRQLIKNGLLKETK